MTPAMPPPTDAQLAAMRRIHIGLWKVYEATLKINQVINAEDLQSLGVKPLPTFYLGDTAQTLAHRYDLRHPLP